MLGFIGSDRGFETNDKSHVRWDRARYRIVCRKQLVVRVVETFSRICAWHKVGVFGSVIDLVNFYLSPSFVWIKLVTCQSFERLVCRRSITIALIQKPKHLIERSILQH